MAVMSGNLYDALRSVGVDDAKARGAAEELADVARSAEATVDLRKGQEEIRKDVATLKVEVGVLKWMVGINVALTVAVIGLVLRLAH